MLKTIKNIFSLRKAFLFAFGSLCVFSIFPTPANAQYQYGFSNKQFVSNVVSSNPAVSQNLSNIGSTNVLNATSNGLYVVPKYTGSGKVIPDEIRTTIYKASQETGIEMYRLAARIESESSWTEKINSSAGAMGYMQIMPETWKTLGSGDPYNAHDSIMTGARIMVYTDNKTKNRVESDTAYNAGTTKLSNAKKAAKQAGTPEDWAKYLKPEAQKYPGKQVKTEAEIRAQNSASGPRVNNGQVPAVSAGGASAPVAAKAGSNSKAPEAAAPSTPKKTLKEPDYYSEKDKTVNSDGTVNVANKTTTYGGYSSAPYDHKDAQYMLDLLKSDATPEEVAELIKKYPDTLGKISGTGANSNYGLEDRVNKLAKDRMNMGRNGNQLTAEEVEKIRVKAAAAYDVAAIAKKENYILAARMKSNTFYAIDKKISQEEADARNKVLRENIKQKDSHIKMTNESCRLEDMKQEYQGECYSCKVVKLLIQTFMNACSKMYESSKEAGTKLLFYGFILWMVGFALKNVSSLTSLEPSNNINDLLIFLFKVLFAYVCINGGLITFTTYIVDPIMIAGADYGLSIIDSISAFIGKAPQSPVYKYEGAQIVSPLVINKIFEINRAIDYTVSTNLVIGNAIICHATHAGAWVDKEIFSFAIRIPNLFLVIVGASVWFCGFMMTLAISYYLVDISYKIGFAILVLPIVLGLWPFDLTKNKLNTCVSIVLKSAATFAFLAIMASYGIVLIDHAYGGATDGGINALFDAVKYEKTEWIAQRFDITGPYFIILLIAYLYAIKLLPQGATEYVSKFFPDNVFGGSSPMHSKLTQVTAMAKQATVGAAKGVAKGAGGIAKKGLGAFKNNNGEQGTSMGGNAAENAGQAAQGAGKSAQKTGSAMEKSGAALDKGGAAASKAGDSIMAAGKAKTATGVGAIAGVPLMALGAIVKGAGMAAQVAGKTAKVAGKATKTAGKVAESAGKAAENAGKATNSAWNKTTRAPGKAAKKAAGSGWNKIKNAFKK